jgi:hypothetical protein
MMRHRAVHPNAVDPDIAGVARWRRKLLERASFEETLADALSADRRVDLHALLRLIERGCTPELAARILAPLDTTRERAL